jgi:hypothetical protein
VVDELATEEVAATVVAASDLLLAPFEAVLAFTASEIATQPRASPRTAV